RVHGITKIDDAHDARLFRRIDDHVARIEVVVNELGAECREPWRKPRSEIRQKSSDKFHLQQPWSLGSWRRSHTSARWLAGCSKLRSACPSRANSRPQLAR